MLKGGIWGKKKKEFGGFKAVVLIDLSGGLHYKQAVAISNLRIVSESCILRASQYAALSLKNKERKLV